MAGDFRNGTTFEMDGGVFRVVEFQHVKPGKGAAFVRTKLKNVITGAVLEKTFNPSDKYPGAEIEKKTMQYLYNDGDLYYFMDNDTYDQMPLNKADLGDCLKYLKENMEVTILSFKGKVFAVEPPIFVELEVIYTNYTRHFSDTKNTVCNVLEDLKNRFSNSIFTIALKGSGAMSASSFLELPFIQEVVSCKRSV